MARAFLIVPAGKQITELTKDMKIQATARIQITLEIDANQPWSEDCAVSQLYKQAASDGKSAAQRIIVDAAKNGHRVRMIGDPKVTGVFSEQLE